MSDIITTLNVFVKSPWGVFCVGVLSSIVATLLYRGIGELIKYASKKIKHRRLVSFLTKIGETYGEGFTTAYAMSHTSFHQMLQVGGYVVNLIIAYAKIAGVALIGIALLVVFHELVIARLVIVSLTCAIAAILYQRARFLKKMYDQMYDYVYGDKFKDQMMEGIRTHWDKILGKEKLQKEKPRTKEDDE